MKTLFYSLVLLFLIFSSPAKAGVINFGFYYAPVNGWANSSLDQIKTAVNASLIDLNRYMNISAKNIFVKKLPFSPDVVTRNSKTGIDGDAFFEKIYKQTMNYERADFVFFIVTTPIVLLLTTCDDGFAEDIPGKLAAVRYRIQPSQDYFAIVIAHELGHLVGLEHLSDDVCNNNFNMLMCPAPPKHLKNIITGKSFRDAVKNASH